MLTPSSLLTAVAAATISNTTPFVPPLAQPPAVEAARAPARQLVVLSYNIHGLPWPITKGRKHALEAIGKELAQLRAVGHAPDIVLIQEGFDDVASLVKLSGYRYWASGPTKRQKPPGKRENLPGPRYLVSGEGWGKLTGSGLHVLSDLPLSDIRTTAFSNCAGFDCLANKGVMMVHVDAPGVEGGVDIVNTHLNSRKAAKVPAPRSLRAHNDQVDELNRFVEQERDAGVPLLLGGDFNVKNAPDRYYYKLKTRPFTVVSEFCNLEHNTCEGAPPPKTQEPWLVSQDLQAFAASNAISVRPMKIDKLFADHASGGRLSDHDGLLVRYELAPR